MKQQEIWLLAFVLESLLNWLLILRPLFGRTPIYATNEEEVQSMPFMLDLNLSNYELVDLLELPQSFSVSGFQEIYFWQEYILFNLKIIWKNLHTTNYPQWVICMINAIKLKYCVNYFS